LLFKPLVFLSSTSDLSQERQAVADDGWISRYFNVYLFEEEGASRDIPLERCREMISQSDFFIGLIGKTYGSTLPDNESKSIVEWEYDTATTVDDLEMMFFLREEAKDPGIDARQQNFVRRLISFNRGLWCKFFKTPNQLVEQVKDSLTQLLIKFKVRMKRENIWVSKRWQSINVPIAFLICAGLCLIVYFQLEFNILPNSAMIAICVALAVAIVMLFLIIIFPKVRDGH